VFTATAGNDTLQGDGQNTNFYFPHGVMAANGADTVSDSGGTDRVTFSALSNTKLVVSAVDGTNILVTATDIAGSTSKGTVTIARSIEQLSASDVAVDASNVNDLSVNPVLTGVSDLAAPNKGYIFAYGPADNTINISTMDPPNAVGVIVLAGGGNDTITGHGSATNFLYGGAGNDTITGGANNDTIYGGTGDDTINGASGTDAIWLGQTGGINEGNDTVRIGNLIDGVDTINNFTAFTGGAGDRIQFVSNANTALDDTGEGGGILTWHAAGTINVTNGNSEAVYFSLNMAASSVTTATLASNANSGGNATTANGADALFVVATSDSKTLIYSYTESNNTVEAGDFTLVATLDTALTAAQAQASIVLG